MGTKLRVYVLDRQRVELRPAPVERAWMEATPEHFAFRCLPLNIANAHGWELLCPSAFVAILEWRRRSGRHLSHGRPGEADRQLQSHFGSGVLTFHVPCLLRTDPEFDLMVQGPVNAPKDGILRWLRISGATDRLVRLDFR